MLLQLLEQLERVVMPLAQRERLRRQFERLLEVAELVRQERAVEKGLEHVRRHALDRVEVGARGVDVALPELKHAEVGVRLGVRRVDRDRDLEGLCVSSRKIGEGEESE